MSENDFSKQIEREAELFAKMNQEKEAVESDVEDIKDQPEKVAQVTSLGKARKFQEADNDPLLASEIGWKNVPLENLPSKGMFYEDNTQIAIRAASVSEIRHWSTIDENDLLGTDDMLNFIMDKCCRIKVPGKPGSSKDLLEIDRFYLIFAAVS